jgi:glucose-6-phosphate 1-epimerase
MVQIIDSRELYPRQEAGIPLLVVENRWARAALSLQGAQILSYTPVGSSDLLWLSPKARLSSREPIRGGIPICFPWFASGSGGQAPFHGFARICLWTLLETSTLADGSIILTLTLEDGKETRRLLDHAFSLRFTITIGPRLSMEFKAKNDGDGRLCLEHLWHSYFAVQDISRTSVKGLEKCYYIDKLDERKRKRQDDELSFDRATDRIYLDVPSVQTISFPSGSISIESSAACAVVWNAWDHDGEIDDLGAGTHREYLCVERGDVDEKAHNVKSCEEYSAHMTIEGHRAIVSS